MGAIRVIKRPDGVAVLTFDNPKGKVNILSPEVVEEFRGVIDDIECDPGVKACVLVSAKPDNFIAGADLKFFLSIRDPAVGERFSREGHALLDRVAGSSKPTVAAIAGLALGGGLEVALACSYRLAADDPKVVLGLPEVQLGLLPAGGGTVRLPRLVGLPAALPMMLTGQRVRARKALKMGLVDALTSPGGIEETAIRTALGLLDGSIQRSQRKRPWMEKLLESPPGRILLFRQAHKSVLAKTRGLYPSPLSILDCVRTGYAKGPAAGYDRESVLFGQLVAGPECKALIGLFEATTELKKPLDATPPRPVGRLAVLGAGFMGSGIAAVSLELAPVVVRDLSQKALDGCARGVYSGLSKRVKSGAISRFERDRLFARLHLTQEAEALRRADLVIEAVFEDLELKRKVLAEVEALVPAECVFASNTSALPIAAIAEKALHPERVLGMHYFSPVPKMPLLELVVAEKTAPWAVATARAFAVKQGKTAIVVEDGPGFYTTRILSPFLNEAVLLLEEGARMEALDSALRDFGYPVGPVTLLDEVGIDVGAHVAKELGPVYAHRGLGASDALPRLFEAGYQGRKNGLGFYVYPSRGKKGRKRPNAEVYGLLGGAPRRPMDRKAMAERLALLMANEAVHCLQEGVLSCPRDGDVGAVFGLGFPPFRGGPFRYLDALGARQAVDQYEALAKLHGQRFTPAPLLSEMAKSGKKFYEE
ncbi:MAG: 3-hydroxyacyl-CoA dehydrogenase NAD-binding domain-containing protein [Acidobacteriota bacterium]